MKGYISRNFNNLRGWRTDRKIVVIESDDWGTVRMSSLNNLAKFVHSGINVQKCHYVQNDALATAADLDLLFELLSSFKDSQNRYPVITANVIMTNPDFKKIEAADFTEYHYELFTKTLAKYPDHKNSFNRWEKGIEEGLFYPQFHGREHLQVLRWMDILKNAESETRKAFNAGVFGLSTTVSSEKRKSFMASYDWDDRRSRDFVLESIPVGLSLFNSLFGFKSLSAIAPNYIWHRDVEKVLRVHGVRYIQSAGIQKSPEMNRNKFKKIRHFTGEKNDLGQKYIVRNCSFEPSSNPYKDWVDKCLRSIENAFFWKKPAIITMHRVNFIGFINAENRDRNLKELRRLLEKIVQIWPDVEFMTTDQVGQIIEYDE